VLVEKITSRQNPLVKRFRRIRDGAERHYVFLEGIRLIEEALDAGAHFESVAYTPDVESSERGPALLKSLRGVQCRGALVSKQVMDAIADTESPQGVVAVVSRPYYEPADVFRNKPQLIVVADQLQDPGNIGAIVRTAEAMGATSLVTTRKTVDPFNRKALRASMGSALRLPVATDVAPPEVVRLCREHKIQIVTAQPLRAGPRASASKPCDKAMRTGPVALVVCREGGAVASDVLAGADSFAHIPMKPGVDSLNVAAAAAVLLYEAARQRKFKFR
jgi:TrmH family RNA methyltransferase